MVNLCYYIYEHSHNCEYIENCNTKKKKKKKNKKTKTEHPRLIIWMSHSIVSICQDATTNGVCRFRAKVRATHYEVALRNTTFFRVMGNVGRIVKDDFLNPHRTLVRWYRCTTYITNAVSIRMQAAMTNVESKYLCQTPNMWGSVSKGYAIMTSSLTSSTTISQQKEF